MPIRPAKGDDVRAVRNIAKRAYIRYVPRIGRSPAPMAADFLGAVERGTVSVAEAEGVVFGYVIAFPRDDDYFIENIAVDPAMAGLGLGKALMDHAEAAAEAAGKRFVRLYTNVRMHENFPFYAGLGYRVTREAVEDGFHRVYFEKDLAKQ